MSEEIETFNITETAEETLPESDFEKLFALVTKLRKYRQDAGITISKIATLTGITNATLTNLENGKNRNPKWNTLLTYARAVGKNIVLTVE